MNYFVAGWLALMAAAPCSAHAASNPDFGPLAGFIQQARDATVQPSGTAVAVVRDGRIIYEGYFGFSDIGARTPVSRDTVFYIASATKPFFALNALLKEDVGQLDMRMSLQQMFPNIRFTGFAAESVTLRDLLVHSSGVDNQPLVWSTAFSGLHDAQSRLALVAASYPDEKAALGTFKYTNVGYNILSVWSDRYFATPWQQQLDDAIFRPLGMQRRRPMSARPTRPDGRWPSLIRSRAHSLANRCTSPNRTTPCTRPAVLSPRRRTSPDS